MIIGGLVKFSLIDYPGKASAVVFVQGCNFCCPYCHNPELVLPEEYADEISEKEIFDFLNNRKNKLDAVVITGGEPTHHLDLKEFLKKVKEMGFLIKLDTNGSNPDMIKDLIKNKMVDYIAMDIKAPLKKYKKITKKPIDIKRIKKSIDLIINSGIDHEFRTTVVKSQLSFDDLREIAKSIKDAQKYFLQKFVPAKKLNDPSFTKETSYSEEELKNFINEISTFVRYCGVR